MIVVKSISADAQASNLFGYYDPVTGEKITLTNSTLWSVSQGETWGIGPFDQDVQLQFWFFSTYTNSPGSFIVVQVAPYTWEIQCEDGNDGDYNDYVARVEAVSLPQVEEIHFKRSLQLVDTQGKGISPNYIRSDPEVPHIGLRVNGDTTASVTLSTGPIPGPTTYTFWGTVTLEDGTKSILFPKKSVTFTKSFSEEQLSPYPLTIPQSIQLLRKITWNCQLPQFPTKSIL